jgi:shikimate kinase
MIYILLGYMGSGKTSLGKTVSKLKNIPFIDLDQRIESFLGTSIAEFIEEKGELAFRKTEHQQLKLLLENMPKDCVLAVGGGTPVFYDHMDLLNSAGVTVYLDVSVVELARRLANDVQRPLINNQDDLAEFVAKHLFERRPYYSLANYRIKGDQLTAEDVLACF